MTRHPARAAAALLLLGAAGCYRYAPLAPSELQPGREVRAELGDRGAAELARWIGPRGVSVAGRLQRVSDSSLTISVTEVVRRDGVTEPWRGEPVVVARPDVAAFRERRFDRARTLLAGLGVAAVLLGADAALGESGLLFRGRGREGGGARQ